MNLNVTGTVTSVDTQTGTSKSGNQWQKKLFTIEYFEGTVKKTLAFELFGEDRINNNPFRKGQQVTVMFDVVSTEWRERWFTQLQAYRVSKFDSKSPKPNSEGDVSSTVNDMFDKQSKDEELPF